MIVYIIQYSLEPVFGRAFITICIKGHNATLFFLASSFILMMLRKMYDLFLCLRILSKEAVRYRNCMFCVLFISLRGNDLRTAGVRESFEVAEASSRVVLILKKNVWAHVMKRSLFDDWCSQHVLHYHRLVEKENREECSDDLMERARREIML
mmetsp:Transcript_29761/g.55661  ORF Transcript_29761/g.55661 Transcript_29761/m.55661 type:complete len:153 (+) Transcript_29761:1014-1472(+)